MGLANRDLNTRCLVGCLEAVADPVVKMWNGLDPPSFPPLPLPSNRHHRSNGDCQEGKRENYQVCSVQYCVQRLCSVQCTHVSRPNSSLDWVLFHWAHFTVLRYIFVYVLLLACVVL